MELMEERGEVGLREVPKDSGNLGHAHLSSALTFHLILTTVEHPDKASDNSCGSRVPITY